MEIHNLFLRKHFEKKTLIKIGDTHWNPDDTNSVPFVKMPQLALRRARRCK